MRTFKNFEFTQQVLVSITCNRCNKEVTSDDTFEFQEVFSTTICGGYGSVLGDGNEYEIDLCQQCLKDVLGTFLQLKCNYIWNEQQDLSFAELKKQRVTCPECNGAGVFGPDEDQLGCERCQSEGRIYV